MNFAHLNTTSDNEYIENEIFQMNYIISLIAVTNIFNQLSSLVSPDVDV